MSWGSIGTLNMCIVMKTVFLYTIPMRPLFILAMYELFLVHITPHYLMLFYLQIALMDDTDLTMANFSLTFPDGTNETIRCTTVPIKNDTELEGDHAFTVDIVSAGSSPHAIVGALSTATVTIEDDESKSVSSIIVTSDQNVFGEL